MKYILVLTLVLAAVSALHHENSNFKIIGGTETNIEKYPFAAALLFIMRYTENHLRQSCGGTIINTKAILTAAYCFNNKYPGKNESRWRARVGSSFYGYMGTLLTISKIVVHPNFTYSGAPYYSSENDIAIIHVKEEMTFGDKISAAKIAGPGYKLPDYEPVQAIGWGYTQDYTPFVAKGTNLGGSVTLREVEIYVIDMEYCRKNYAKFKINVSDEKICAGGHKSGKGQTVGDSGSPLIHNGTVVGHYCRLGVRSGHFMFPGLNLRLSCYSDWIKANSVIS